jgi:hypothetical protein
MRITRYLLLRDSQLDRMCLYWIASVNIDILHIAYCNYSCIYCELIFIYILIICNILPAVKIVVSNKNDTKIDYRMVIEIVKYQNSGSFYYVFIPCYNFLSVRFN